ncbi:hypothetical protein BKA66DRAFT_571312 [Pyrenochaeta sp. MPI-SDFR-AT-0127]|nr:hypothetical protein BKA66DRAFT_571312 [Pyrenochaeta sp. MPI-SDFR-AT-0127]
MSVTTNAEDDGSQDPQNLPTAINPLTNDAIINKWLRSLYLEHDYAGSSLSISIDDFMNIIATSDTDSSNSWLLDDQLALPVVLLTQLQKKRSDILVIPTTAASYLGSVGLGQATRKDFLQMCPHVASVMNLDSTRWIVIPCNDGMTQHAEQELLDRANEEAAEHEDVEDPRMDDHFTSEKAAAAAAEAAQENPSDTQKDSVAKQTSKPRVVGLTHRGIGTHWGLMIIDKQREEARWFDGHLTLKREHKKTYIKAMFKSGQTAGKILCGYDQVMEREPGKMKTSTLKHVPHDQYNNTYQGDAGSACGPWVFAMLRYILDRPEFLTNDRGLKGAFSRSSRARNNRDMAFHSSDTRVEMQDIIRQEADRKLPGDNLPYNLTAPILKILGTPSIQHLLTGLNRFRGKPHIPSRRRDETQLSYGGDEDDSGDGNDGGVDPPTIPIELTLDEMAELMQKAEDNPELLAQLSEEQQKFIAEQRSLLPAKRLTPKKKTPAPKAKAKAKAKAFDVVGSLQNHVVNFVQLPTNQLEDFVALNLIGDSLKPDMSEWEQRAILTHVLGDFDQLSDADSTTWKAQDPRFGSLQTASHDQVIEELKNSVSAIPRIELCGFVTSYPQSYIDHLASQQQGSGKGHLGADGKITNEKPVEEEEALSRKGWPEGVDELPNFARISSEDLAKWEASNPELFQEKKEGHNDVTSRALLHRNFKGSFQSASPEDLLEVWIRDETVFDDLDDGQLTAEQILHSMMKVHEPHGLKWLLADLATKKNKGKPTKRPKPAVSTNANKRPHGGTQSDNAAKKVKVDYATISTTELMKEVNADIKKHESIQKGKTPNEYTYRAILFVAKGGTFQIEEDARCNTIWIRDSNVFTEGVDFEVTRENKVKLLNGIFHGQIRTRMQTRYEQVPQEVLDSSSLDSSEDEEDAKSKTPAPGPRPGPSNLPGMLDDNKDTGGQTKVPPKRKGKSPTPNPATRKRSNREKPSQSKESKKDNPSKANKGVVGKASLVVVLPVALPQASTDNNAKRKRGEVDATDEAQKVTSEPAAKKPKRTAPKSRGVSN